MSLRTHILDVGHGDSIILELPNSANETVLCFIDCYQFDETERYMNKHNIQPDVVKLVVATHPHRDHILGLKRLLEHFEGAGIPVSMFWDSGHDHASDTYKNLMTYIEGSNIFTMFPKAGSWFLFEDVEIRVLAPPDPPIQNSASDCNNASIVLQVRYGKAPLLFGADAQFASWAHINMNQLHNMSGRVLKVSHHGSKRGTFFEAIETLRPYYAIISASHSVNAVDEDHPHPITIEALREFNVRRIYCTHDDGNIMIESRKNGVHTITPGR